MSSASSLDSDVPDDAISVSSASDISDDMASISSTSAVNCANKVLTALPAWITSNKFSNGLRISGSSSTHNNKSTSSHSAETLDLVCALTNYGNPKFRLTWEERLKITKFFEIDDLWKKFWVEYEGHVLIPLRNNNTNRACVLKFHRLQRLYFDENQKGWRYYMRPNLDKSNWKMEDWAAWFVMRVYIANRDSENGIFASVNLGHGEMSSGEATEGLKQIWLVFLKARKEWRSANPYKPVKSSQKLRGIFKKKKRARKSKSKPEKIPNGANQARGQITLVWEQGSGGEPVALRIDGIANKTYLNVVQEIIDRLHLDPAKTLNTDFEVSEPLGQVIQHYKATKAHGAQVDLKELTAAATRMRNFDWDKFQKRAVSSVDPILVRMKVPGPVDNAITRAIIRAAATHPIHANHREQDDGVSSPQHGHPIPADESEQGDGDAISQYKAGNLKKRSRPDNFDNSGMETPPVKRARYQATVETEDESEGENLDFNNHALDENLEGYMAFRAAIEADEHDENDNNDEVEEDIESDEHEERDKSNEINEDDEDELDENGEDCEGLAVEDLEDEEDDDDLNDDDDENDEDNEDNSNDEEAEDGDDEEPEGLSEDDEEKPYIGNLQLTQAE